LFNENHITKIENPIYIKTLYSHCKNGNKALISA